METEIETIETNYRNLFRDAVKCFRVGTGFFLRFKREEFNSATENCTTIPYPFELTFPYEYAHFRRSDSISVTWSPVVTDSLMEISVSGDCLSDYTVEAFDSGVYVLPASLWFYSDDDDSFDCNVDIEVSRIHKGTIG